MFTVAIYLADLAYGGHEEGGWYYPCGELEPDVPVLYFETESEAVAAMQAAQGLLCATWNVGRHSISSVLSDGEFRAVVWEGHPPPYYPRERPYYD